MRKTYEVYTRVGSEPLKFSHCMYAENDSEIIAAMIKQIDMLKSYSDVVKEFFITYGEKRVFNVIF